MLSLKVAFSSFDALIADPRTQGARDSRKRAAQR
jgi:hypothetical protein